jgi:hypothetical protein
MIRLHRHPFGFGDKGFHGADGDMIGEGVGVTIENLSHDILALAFIV